ncbi:hypothetical protein [Streptomyces sp. NPDC021224]|uniref:hypothetical protein n=1 Tax=unclassified Streptomyces TaxID=2593676 RepID=UPI0037B3ADFF
MRTRIAAAAVAAAALVTLTACSSDHKDGGTDGRSTASATTQPASPSDSDSPADSTAGDTSGAGVPAKPDPATQQLVIGSLQQVDPALAADPDQTIASARTQCQVLAGRGDGTGHQAAQRFSTPGHPLTDAQGIAINAALNALLCDPSF